MEITTDKAATPAPLSSGRSRSYGPHRIWSETEISLLSELYPLADWDEILSALPGRTRPQIKGKANGLGVAREARFRMPEGISEEEKIEIRRKKQVDASRKWREQNPDQYRATQLTQDQKPERKEKKKARAAVKRKTEKGIAYAKEYRNRPEVKEKAKITAKTSKFKERMSSWLKKPEQRRKHADRMRKERSSPQGLLSNRMRAALRRGVSKVGSGSALKSVGYTIDELRMHLEKQFLKGMSWDNASQWHIDHIIPLSAFSFESIDDAEFKICWGLPNLRPLWKTENLSKRAKILSLL